jgi:hypothetical protein
MSGDGIGEGARITYEEVLAAFGEPRDRIDRIAVFAAEQSEALRRLIDLCLRSRPRRRCGSRECMRPPTSC